MTAFTTTLHTVEYADPYPGHKGTDVVEENCPFCFGGYIPAFSHRDGGVCYRCGGTGTHRVVVKSMRSAEHRRVNEHNRRVAREQSAVALLESDKELDDAFQTLGLDNDFAKSVRDQMLDSGKITDGQRAGIVRAARGVAERQEQHDQAQDVPQTDKRIQVEGTVLTVKWQDSQFGGSFKMLVQSDQGWKVWGTAPSTIEPDRGDRVSFTARVERSRDDSKFGFYSRPTKAAVLTAA